MTTTTVSPRAAATADDTTWLRVAQVSVALVLPALVILAITGTFFTTISEGGDFRYQADYWYTAAGLPITLGGIGLALAVHRLQHGADGRLGRVGVWVNTMALVELFVQMAASIGAGSELRWGPSYPLCTALSLVGTALLAAGSWRTGLLPKWVLGTWPVVWILGSLASFGPTPLLLAAFLVVLAVSLTRRVNEPAQRR